MSIPYIIPFLLTQPIVDKYQESKKKLDLYTNSFVYYNIMKNTIIFDLDGTLAIIDKRRDLSRKPNGKIDFKILHDPSNIHLDEPNMPVVKMARLFAEDGFNIVIFSGRSDKTKHTTRSWLTHNRIPFHSLVMRPHKSMGFVPDEVLKKKMLCRKIIMLILEKS